MAEDKPDWLFGAGASRTEKALAHGVSVAGVAVLAFAAHDLGWAWWQWAVAVVLVIDLVGGVVANGLDSAKRFYHSPLPLRANRATRFLHHPVGFTVVHVQPILAGLVLPGGAWWWGLCWYGWALAGAFAVHVVPDRLERPVALAVVTCGVLVAPLVPAPPAMEWLPAVLLLKLVLAHGVSERNKYPEPLRT